MANPTGKGGWTKGLSGNPNGRPPNSRALSALLERAGGKTVSLPDGKRISGKRFMAQAVWQILTEGKVTLPTGVSWTVEPKDWLEAVKWMYGYLDPPRQRTELTGADGGPVVIELSELSDDELERIARGEAVAAGAGKRRDRAAQAQAQQDDVSGVAG